MHYWLMNEYGVDWPLWQDGLCADGDPALSPRLEADVRAWAADFDDHYLFDRGWPSESALRRSERQGRGLCAAIARELEPRGDTVEFRHWETQHVPGAGRNRRRK